MRLPLADSHEATGTEHLHRPDGPPAPSSSHHASPARWQIRRTSFRRLGLRRGRSRYPRGDAPELSFNHGLCVNLRPAEIVGQAIDSVLDQDDPSLSVVVVNQDDPATTSTLLDLYEASPSRSSIPSRTDCR